MKNFYVSFKSFNHWSVGPINIEKLDKVVLSFLYFLIKLFMPFIRLQCFLDFKHLG